MKQCFHYFETVNKDILDSRFCGSGGFLRVSANRWTNLTTSQE